MPASKQLGSIPDTNPEKYFDDACSTQDAAGHGRLAEDLAEQLQLHNQPPLNGSQQTGSAALWCGADIADSDSSCCCQDGAASKLSTLFSSSQQTAMVAAAMAAFEELAKAVSQAADLQHTMRLEAGSGAALQQQQLVRQQHAEDLIDAVSCLSLRMMYRFSPTSSSSQLAMPPDSSCSCSCSRSTSGSACSCAGSSQANWFAKVTRVSDSSEKRAMLQQLQDLIQQSAADEAEMASVREDLLQRTDGRIHDETALRDELARRVAALEDQVQEDREEEEEDDGEEAGLRMQLVNLRRYTAASTAVANLQKLLAQQQAANSILHVQLSQAQQHDSRASVSGPRTPALSAD